MTKKRSVARYAAASESLLFQHAFNETLHSNIITIAGSGKIITANAAACRLLGYSKKELLTKNSATVFDTKEKGFQTMLRQRKSDGHAVAYLKAIRKNGNPFPCEITSAVFMDKDGIEKAVTTITDITQRKLKQQNIDTKNNKIVAHNILLAKSKQKKIDTKKDKIVTDDIALAKSKQAKIDMLKEKIVAANIVMALAKSDNRLEENNAWIKYIAKASYDVMWDWNVQTDEIYIGDSIREVFGYKVPKDNIAHFKNFIRCLIAEEKDKIETKLQKALASRKKTWSDSFKFKRRDGSIAVTNNRASIVRDDNGKAIRLIGATQDISTLRELEKKLKSQVIIRDELHKIFIESSKLSFEGKWEWDLLTNDFVLGKGFEKLFGHALKNNSGDIKKDWIDHLHPADKNAVEKSVRAAIESNALHWERECRFIKADGLVTSVFNRATIIRDNDGKAFRMIGIMQDITKVRRLEEKLEQELQLKESQITEAMEDARNSERSGIGKELHDNVNQLLGASKMYLEMGKKGGENSLLYLNKSSDYTLTAIEEIRKLTRGLITDIIKELGLSQAIKNISRDMMEVNALQITCSLSSFIESSVNDKLKLNIFRIVQEQLNNILKYAKATKVDISLSQNKKSVTLFISDNGAGFDIAAKRDGIGIINIKSRASAYNGTADFVSQPRKGCVLSVVFPVTNMLLNAVVSSADHLCQDQKLRG
jgi:PAS domain S-box-containing protein